MFETAFDFFRGKVDKKSFTADLKGADLSAVDDPRNAVFTLFFCDNGIFTFPADDAACKIEVIFHRVGRAPQFVDDPFFSFREKKLIAAPFFTGEAALIVGVKKDFFLLDLPRGEYRTQCFAVLLSAG